MNKSKVQSRQSNMWKMRKAVMMKRKRTDKGTHVKQAQDYSCTEHKTRFPVFCLILFSFFTLYPTKSTQNPRLTFVKSSILQRCDHFKRETKALTETNILLNMYCKPYQA